MGFRVNTVGCDEYRLDVRWTLSKILGSAVEWGYIQANPVRMTRLPTRRRSHAKAVLTPVQLRLLVATLPEPSRSLVLLLMLTGLRIGELLALRWRNVDLAAGLLRVEETVYEGHFDEPKSRHSVRPIPLGPFAVAVLSEQTWAGTRRSVDLSVFQCYGKHSGPTHPVVTAAQACSESCRIRQRDVAFAPALECHSA